MKIVRFAVNIKETKPRQVVGFSLAKTFNETMAMDLKEWSLIKNIYDFFT